MGSEIVFVTGANLSDPFLHSNEPKPTDFNSS